MFKRTLKFTTALLASAAVLAACGGGNAHAATNNFVAADGRIYSVDGVREISATPAGFQLTYTDGNYSDVFADNGYAILAQLVANAPALKRFIQVGSTGQYLNADEIKKAQCQVGTATPAGIYGSYGDHTFVAWMKAGYTLVNDPGCAFYAALKAGSAK